MVDLSRFGIPEEFRDRRWMDLFSGDLLQPSEIPVYEKIWRIGERWVNAVVAQKTNYGLFLYGANGCGKTTFMCLLMKLLLKHGYPCDRVLFPQLHNDFYKEWRVPDYALRRDPLFIEEVAKEYKTKQEHSEYVMEFVLKNRSEQGLITSMSSNADLEYLTKRYGPTFESILKGRFFPVNFPEVDLRVRAARGAAEKILGD